MTAVWQQQVFALDARFNAHRAPNHPNFRTLYIRRRNQLLREYSKGEDTNLRRQYLKIRCQILQQRYGLGYDQASMQSRSMSARSSSRVSESPEYTGWDPPTHRSSTEVDHGLVPTRQAEASRAIVGGNTIAENYAFVGVHHIFDQHTAAVTMTKFAYNDRSRLCCASNDGSVSICNVTTSPPSVDCVLTGHKKAVTACDWSVANDLVVSCSLDGTLCLWDVTSHSCLRCVRDQAGVELLSCAFQPANNNMVIVGNGRGMVQVLNVSTGIYPRGGSSKMGGKVLSLAFDASGQLIWAGNDKGTIVSFSFDLETGRLSKLRRLVVGEDCAITCISWRAWVSREAREPLLLVNSSNNCVSTFRVIDREGGLQLKRRLNVRHKSSRYLVRSTFCPIMSFRQGTCIVTGSEDSCVYFLDVEREKGQAVVNKLQGHACPVLGVSFNYDESLLATSDAQGLVIVWSRARGDRS
ncbi:WD repeat-containing protein 13-like [Macrosteles quadrilineatus]|uniref:WD repeat-containing protein 13-like n=1 Tax=Macrosteles quadrilineatus TaxID=74068 RepID=UPI0023E0CB75|nr:WD repeat-containing protein 13-like [Macrosteles quadrilineatus]